MSEAQCCYRQCKYCFCRLGCILLPNKPLLIYRPMPSSNTTTERCQEHRRQMCYNQWESWDRLLIWHIYGQT